MREPPETWGTTRGAGGNPPGPLTFSGPCPQCAHVIEVSVQYRSAEEIYVASVPDASTGDDTVRPPELVMCNCVEGHAVNNPKRLGCGYFWVARPERTDSRAEWHLQLEGRPHVARAVQALRQGPTDRTNAEDRRGVQQVAEKWIPGVAALVGLLGLAGAVIAQDSASALTPGWRWVAYLLVVTAVICAVVATVSAYMAAFGFPASIRWDSEKSIVVAEDRVRNRDRATKVRLLTAVTSAMVALVCLVAALGVLWLAP